MLKKINHYLTVFVLLLVIVILSILLYGFISVNAEYNDIIIEDFSTDEMSLIRYSNLDSLAKKTSRFSFFNNISAPNDENGILEKIGINEEDLGAISKESLLNAKSVSVANLLFSIDDDGNVTRSSGGYKTTSKDFSDIINDNGNGGYMAGRIVIVQNPAKNKETVNKDGEVTSFDAYGFDVTCNMWWLTEPNITSEDSFSFGAINGSVFTEDDHSCNAMADVTENGETNIYYMDVATYYTNMWPIFKFNLPDTLIDINGIALKRYSNFRFQSTSTIFATDNFNIKMAYFHKQLAIGDYSIGFDLASGGFSISASLGAIVRKYETPAVFVSVIK